MLNIYHRIFPINYSSNQDSNGSPINLSLNFGPLEHPKKISCPRKMPLLGNGSPSAEWHLIISVMYLGEISIVKHGNEETEN